VAVKMPMFRKIFVSLCFSISPLLAGGPYFADGIKIGEVDADSAIVWARLTAEPERNLDGIPFGKEDSAPPEGKALSDMRYSVPGAPGEVRVCWSVAAPAGGLPERQISKWTRVDPKADFTVQIPLRGLAPASDYKLSVESRPPGGEKPARTIDGAFCTAPAPGDEAAVRFVVTTGHRFDTRDDKVNGHKIYPAMERAVHPDFLVHTGDILYYDKNEPYAKSVEMARYKWNRMFSLPFDREFYQHHAAYFIKDDHDALKNDCWPGQTYGDLTWEQGLKIFRDEVPMGESTYRTVRWGRDLQIWMVEGRDFRSPNDMPDGERKTIWGKEQKEWLYRTFAESDATFRILASPTPVVGPDRKRKNDNHANEGFAWEGREIRRFIASQKNAWVVCGDRHWLASR